MHYKYNFSLFNFSVQLPNAKHLLMQFKWLIPLPGSFNILVCHRLVV